MSGTMKSEEPYSGEVIDESARYSLREVCEICGVHAERVIELVEFGVVEPRGGRPEYWEFPPGDVQRVRRAMNLLNDLGLNLAGVSLSLDLLDRIEELRYRIRRLERELRWLRP